MNQNRGTKHVNVSKISSLAISPKVAMYVAWQILAGNGLNGPLNLWTWWNTDCDGDITLQGQIDMKVEIVM